MKGKFNRHENMTDATRRAILEVTSELGYKGEEGEMHNYLCGFFDGYDYSDDIQALQYFKDLEQADLEQYELIAAICEEVTNYPKIQFRISKADFNNYLNIPTETRLKKYKESSRYFLGSSQWHKKATLHMSMAWLKTPEPIN